MFTGKQRVLVLSLIVLAAAFRIAIVHYLPNDTTDDSLGYEQIARNLLEHHVYSHVVEPPYTPTLVRLPGYPLFLAAIYSVFGHTNNTAVRVVQALIDTGTCLLAALLAWLGNRTSGERTQRQLPHWRWQQLIHSRQFMPR